MIQGADIQMISAPALFFNFFEGKFKKHLTYIAYIGIIKRFI